MHTRIDRTNFSHSSPPIGQTSLRTFLGVGIGNALEWFDWHIYAAFAAFFSTQFFDRNDPTSALLNTLAVFAVGFIARPFGAVVFGWLADQLGRKKSLTLAVIATSLGSLLIAASPTYAQIGTGASALLVVARIIQGIAHGGELPAAQTYLSEHSPRKHRGLWASSIYISGTTGNMLGLLLGIILNSLLTHEQMMQWGWRIPFTLGAILGLFAFWMRSHMAETGIFRAEKAARKSLIQTGNVFFSVIKNWRTGLQVIGMTCGSTVAYYVWVVTMPTLAQNPFGYGAKDAFTASLVGHVVFLICLPLWGWLSDKWGRRPCMLISVGGNAAVTLPLIYWIDISKSPTILVVAISIQLCFLAAFLGHGPATYAEMFPTHQRASGFGIYYALAIALFGGTAAFVLKAMGNPYHFAWYSTVLLIVCFGTIWKLPETAGKELSQ